jgi:spermidine synthase
MLRAVVFTCGAALMGLEIVATRVLAPYLGNSIYVWGAVISIVMIALSLGYWVGGQVADRLGAARALPPVIAAAGLTTALAPLVAEAVLPLASGLGARLGSLAAATAIFFAPSVLLAMVSPLGVRVAARSGLARIGRSAGGLYAVSTAGSIAGTLATSFWLIPLLSLEPLIVWTGTALLATALLALGLPDEREADPGADAGAPDADCPTDDAPAVPRARSTARTTRALTAALCVAGLATGAAVLAGAARPPGRNDLGETVLYRADTQYHRITVTEDVEARHLRFDRSHQSALRLDDPYASVIRYPDYMHLALALKPDAKRVLVCGLGGGAITRRFWRDYPEMLVDTVEIDPVVVDVARRYFWLPDDERLRVITEDARRYVRRTPETYDVVIVDAYYADALPAHLTTEEFFREVKAVMSRGGVLAYNVISAPRGTRSELFRSMYRTVGRVWDEVWVFPIGYGEDGDAERLRNIIVLATDTRLSEAELRARIATRVGDRVTVPAFERMAEDLYTEPVPLADVPVLTDSHAPTDALIEVQ